MRIVRYIQKSVLVLGLIMKRSHVTKLCVAASLFATAILLLYVSPIDFILHRQGEYHQIEYLKGKGCGYRYKDTGMMTMNSVGRLGNMMCEYAILLGLASINERQAFLEPLMAEKLQALFRLTTPVMTKETFEETPWTEFLVSGILQDRHRHLNQRYLRLTEYPASWTYFHPELRDIIRHEFTFHDSWKGIANKALSELVSDGRSATFIGVHVRRGDYVSYMKERKGVVADKGYFDEAMKRFRSRFHDAAFVVVSNDMKWCKENMDNSSGDVFLVGNGNEDSPGRDMAILAHCNHSIITLGTFGFWAAYMAGGETIYLTKFTTPDSYYSHMHSSGAYFLPEWEGIAANLTPVLVTENPE